MIEIILKLKLYKKGLLLTSKRHLGVSAAIGPRRVANPPHKIIKGYIILSN